MDSPVNFVVPVHTADIELPAADRFHVQSVMDVGGAAQDDLAMVLQGERPGSRSRWVGCVRGLTAHDLVPLCSPQTEVVKRRACFPLRQQRFRSSLQFAAVRLGLAKPVV